MKGKTVETRRRFPKLWAHRSREGNGNYCLGEFWAAICLYEEMVDHTKLDSRLRENGDGSSQLITQLLCLA